MDQREARRRAARALSDIARSEAVRAYSSGGLAGLNVNDRARMARAFERLAAELGVRGGDPASSVIPVDPDQMAIEDVEVE